MLDNRNKKDLILLFSDLVITIIVAIMYLVFKCDSIDLFNASSKLEYTRAMNIGFTITSLIVWLIYSYLTGLKFSKEEDDISSVNQVISKKAHRENELRNKSNDIIKSIKRNEIINKIITAFQLMSIIISAGCIIHILNSISIFIIYVISFGVMCVGYVASRNANNRISFDIMYGINTIIIISKILDLFY